MEHFYRLGDFLPPAASPAGLPGGPGMGSHWATSGILDFQEIAQIATFIKVNSKRQLVSSTPLINKTVPNRSRPGGRPGRVGALLLQGGHFHEMEPFLLNFMIFIKIRGILLKFINFSYFH